MKKYRWCGERVEGEDGIRWWEDESDWKEWRFVMKLCADEAALFGEIEKKKVAKSC